MLRPAAAIVGSIVLVIGPASAAFGQDDVFVTNRESVQAFLNSDGSLDVARIYDQVDAVGSGTVRVENPVSTEGLRNLDGFGGYDVTDDVAVLELDVDGETAFRTVSDFTGELPVSVEPEYRLDGELVEPQDIVGRSGRLDVRITVRNTTAAPTDVTYFGADGNEVTESVNVPIPLVAIFETVLPPSFSSVETADYNVAGDGRGGTVLRANLVLFDGLPTGGSTTTLFYTANISDGVIPEAQLDVVPVQPITHANFDGAFQATAQGMQSGRQLATGGQRLDEGLGQLHDGASELLSGLQLIAEGTEQLRAGLADEAAPGSRELANGALEAANGAGELSAGLNNQLAPGADELADGAQDAADGAGELSAGLNSQLLPGARSLADANRAAADGAGRLAGGLATAESRAPELIGGLEQIRDGLGQLDGGLTLLYNGIGGVPAQAQPIIDGINQLRAGIGSLSEPETLLGGLERIRLALTDRIVPGLNEVNDGVNCANVALQDILTGRTSGFSVTCYGATLAAQLEALRAGVPVNIDAVTRNVLEVLSLRLVNPDDSLDENTLRGGLNLVLGGLTAGDGVIAGVVRLQCGLSNTVRDQCDPARPGLLQGLNLVFGGVNQLVGGVVTTVQGAVGDEDDTPADETLRGGVNGLTDGVELIVEGGNTLLAGLSQLTDGAQALQAGGLQIADGAERLADGTGDAARGAGQLADGLNERLAPGARELADGADEAADGASQLADGNRRIADGADELADGLGDAADGAGELAEGTEDAAEGTPALVDGIGEVRDGVGLLKAGGEDTVETYAPNVALLQAANARGAAEALPYGAPEGSIGTAVYSITLAGEAGEGSQNLTKAIAAIAILGLAAGGVALARRRTTG
jgi:putative membrane protein